jgi:hypothetical protein
MVSNGRAALRQEMGSLGRRCRYFFADSELGTPTARYVKHDGRSQVDVVPQGLRVRGQAVRVQEAELCKSLTTWQARIFRGALEEEGCEH